MFVVFNYLLIISTLTILYFSILVDFYRCFGQKYANNMQIFNGKKFVSDIINAVFS